MANKHGHEPDNGQSGSKAYETRDVKLRPLVVFIAGLAVVGIVVYLVVFLMLRLFSGQAAREDARVAPSSVSRPAQGPGEERLPPEPRIQVNAAADMDALRRQEDARLTTYGWVDRQAGIVRIPIDAAMTQILEEGLPVRQSGSAPAGTTATPPLPKTPQAEVKKVPQ